MMLFIVFLILKLCKVIAWSWWWVTCPLWISIAMVVVFCVLYVMAMVVMSTRKYRKK